MLYFWVGYLTPCLIVGSIKTFTYYRSHIKPETKNATRKQIRGAIGLTFVVSTILAPMIFIEETINYIKRLVNLNKINK